MTNEANASELLADQPDVIFHLAAIVSGEAEKNFELGMRVNLHANLRLLEMCRGMEYKPIIVFASTCGVFGGDLEYIVRDDSAPTPMSSYGTQKAITELLMNDYSRKGFIDARILRLPTIIVRPGKPNAATSSFASAIIREPLSGVETSCPVETSTRIWVLSPKHAVQNFIHGAALETSKLGINRIITLPGITTSVEELVAALERIAGRDTAAKVLIEPDPFIQSIVMTWPPNFEPERALSLGFSADSSPKEIILAYIDDEYGGSLDHLS